MAESTRQQIAEAIWDALPYEAQEAMLTTDADEAADAVLALLSQPTPTAEPPRIEDMAPGTTFTAEGRDGTERLCVVANLDHTVADLDDCVFRSDDWFDASTIRDVTPPTTEE